MNQKELRELIEFLIEKDITEFELERGDIRVRVKRGGEVQYVSAPVAAAPQPVAEPAAQARPASSASTTAQGAPPTKAVSEEEGLHLVRSPIVGTYYDSPSPGAPPFVKPGDAVQVGQILCIIEAMKLMNEIEADATGEVVKKFVQNGQPVEYGQPLFGLKTA
ncbi:MAG TPA: acetyl-CoA carboxylase biotin carboxyl carrier protein [Terriglobales bacterium]|nr:acetyl-CoA carboxylase biotin carboxyl carrier protein [Terriglobales bacterium]